MRQSFLKLAEYIMIAHESLGEMRESLGPIPSAMAGALVGTGVGGVLGGTIGLGLMASGKMENVETGVGVGAAVGAGIGTVAAAPIPSLVLMGLFASSFAYGHLTSSSASTTTSENTPRKDCR